ncbi:hypothetical protein SASPL_145259 [Salvia splendens]|uniref:Leucine-rich PPR motif-containing protein, mitochondrial n=1 Tax=Salvia splendens TaxID=180675 RepID=A0A8X8WHD4_SALSN|nr:hypothetical protein SASPL_145259 [Salvia splendens]
MFNRSLHKTSSFAAQFLSLLPFCRKSQDLKALNSILILRGLIGNQSLIDHFINHCCHLRSPDLALQPFRIIQKPSLYLLNLLIRSLCDNGLFEDVILLYKNCRNSGSSSDKYTFPFVINSCAALRDVWFGSLMHSVTLKNGFGENLFVQTSLLDFYSKIGEIRNARKVVDEIPQPDLIVWNAMISGYSVNGFDYEVIRVFRDMIIAGVKPNASTLATVFPVCSRIEADRVGVSLHGLSYKLGCIEEESLLPALISMYANCGDLLASRDIFDASTRKDVAIWNAMISAYMRNHSLECVGAFHSCVVKFGFKKECSIVSAFVSVYAKLGDTDSAEFLFRGTRVRSLILWNSMVSAYAGHGFYEQSLEAFHLMQVDGFDPDGISVISLLKSCSQLKVAMAGKSAHAFVVRRGFDGNLNVVNALLAFYVDRSEMICSFRIFDRMALKNVVTWNTMISGCVAEGDLERAMLLFHHMREERCNFDMVTLISILPSFHVYQSSPFGSIIHGYAVRTALASDVSLGNALVALELFRDMIKEDIQMPSYVTLLNVLPACEDVHQGKSVHGYIVRRGISLETPLVTSLMIMYARFKISKSCLILFHIGDKMSISLWNTIISANIIMEKVNTVFSFFCELLRSRIEPDEITIQNLISACLHLKNMNISNSLLAHLVKEGFDRDVALVNSLIDMYAKTGSIASARRLFDSLPHKDSVSWSIMINGYGLHGHCEDALSLYSEMRLLGLKPDRITYISVLSACSHGGSVEQGRMVLGSMIHDGVMPGTEHYSCMVDLLGACLSHGNYELGEEVGRFLRPEDCGPYVILHNIYAAAGKWADANDVRLLLEQNQFSKAPGISVVC